MELEGEGKMYISKTACKRCGNKILMIRLDSGKTIPCDPELREFVADVYSQTKYVTESGIKMLGSEPGPDDRAVEHGYIDHRHVCKKLN